MSGAAHHYAEAERILALVDDCGDHEAAMEYLGIAQVHATLAHVAVAVQNTHTELTHPEAEAFIEAGVL